MKKIITLCLCCSVLVSATSQFSVKYDPSIQPTTNMQYFKPAGNNLFVGDCIPFFHNGVYYLYWLIDSAHHSALNGLGGHQWVLSTTKDLKNWTNYPIALGIDEAWEKSICTGSVVYAENKFYAFYATRLINDGKVNEQLSYAISNDGIHFTKQKPNPFYTSAPGYSKRDFRDPKVFVDAANTFHLFVSSRQDSALMQTASGCLVHLTSKDLINWKVEAPILTGQGSVPECPDYFHWNGWYYLVYSDNSNTYYVKSKNALGPWEEPRYQALNEDWSNVVKTAEFINGRRIAAAWVPSKKDNNDDGQERFGGNAVFREVTQGENGVLNTKFPAELLPATGNPISLKPHTDASVVSNGNTFSINSPNGQGAVSFDNIPANSMITLEIEPAGINEEYGFYLKANDNASTGYKLAFSANKKIVRLHNTAIYAVDGLDKNIKVTIIMKDDIIDVSVDGRRCIVNRLIEQKGNFLWIYAKHGYVKFKSILVSPLTENN